MLSKKTILSSATALAAVAAFAQTNATPAATNDHGLVPERVIIVSGDPRKIHKGIVAVLYDSNDFSFHDPSAPRFLFLDRKGKIALGIGGHIYGTVAYDFAGVARSGADFDPVAIPVPADPAQRSALGFSASHSTVFLQLAGHSDRLGTYSAFIQTNFTGGGTDKHELELKQAYFRVGYVTVGLANSTFADPAGVPTVDTQGPNGAVSMKNIHISYTPQITPAIRLGIAAEQPRTSITVGQSAATIAQRVPDIPAFIQYGWAADSHIRLSGILRNLSYRDLIAGKNRITTGYGLQLSADAAIGSRLRIYADASFGRGIGEYINDLASQGVDLIPDPDKPGQLRAPRTFAYAAGLTFNYCRSGFATLAWSQCRLYDRQGLDPDTYRRGSYLSVNLFQTIFPDCLIGLEYARGWRCDSSPLHASANRIMAAIRYSF